MTNFLEQLEDRQVAPKLHTMFCELGIYQRQNVIYVQNSIAALAKLPTSIPNCTLHIITSDESSYMRLDPNIDDTETSTHLFSLDIVTILKIDEINFDMSLFSLMIAFPRLSFLQSLYTQWLQT